MDSKEFISQALRTEAGAPAELRTNAHLLWPLLDALIAAGNVLDLVKKQVFYGKQPDGAAVITLLSEAEHATEVASRCVGLPNAPLRGIDPRVFHAIVGMATESVELLELLRGVLFEAKPFDMVNFSEELGDHDWYKAIALDATGLDEGNIRKRVILKLRTRYPQKFTSEQAIIRNLAAERRVLEGGES